jgi:hypothetical protein
MCYFAIFSVTCAKRMILKLLFRMPKGVHRKQLTAPYIKTLFCVKKVAVFFKDARKSINYGTSYLLYIYS